LNGRETRRLKLAHPYYRQETVNYAGARNNAIHTRRITGAASKDQVIHVAYPLPRAEAVGLLASRQANGERLHASGFKTADDMDQTHIYRDSLFAAGLTPIAETPAF